MSLRVRRNDAIAGEFQGIEDAGVSTSWRLQTDTYMCIDTGAGSLPPFEQTISLLAEYNPRPRLDRTESLSHEGICCYTTPQD